jgi:hypothetical protein
MKNFKLLGVAIAAGSLLLAGPAVAQDEYDEPETEEEEITEPAEEDDPFAEPQAEDEAEAEEDEDDPFAEPEDIDEPFEEPSPVVEERQPLLAPWGLGVAIGGGVNGFTDGDFNDFVDVGGGWEGRLMLGTRTPVGFEAAYIGTANGLDTFGVEDDAILLSNGVEGLLRLNLAQTAVRPYVVGGAAWKRYSVTNTDVNTSNLEDNDNVVEFPVGAGLSYSFNRFLADVRGTFRPAIDNDLLVTEELRDEAELHTWQARANIGFEF